MCAGGRDRQRADGTGVAAHVGEVRIAAALGVARHRRRQHRRRLTAKDRRHVVQAAHSRDGEPVDERRLAGAFSRDDEPRDARCARALRDAQHAAAMAQLAAERQFAEHGPAGELGGRKLLGGDEHAAGGGEVEAGADLAQVGGREVDRDAPLREVESRVDQRCLDALARLADGGVAASDDRERGQATAHIDLDGDPPGGEAVDREGRHMGEHSGDGRRDRVTPQHVFVTIPRRRRNDSAGVRKAARILREVVAITC